jgi:NADPH-dependent 7-cyano-7-deazaguanine reductase QueF-like protein
VATEKRRIPIYRKLSWLVGCGIPDGLPTAFATLTIMSRFDRIVACLFLSLLFICFGKSAQAQTNGAQFISQSVPTTWATGQTQTLSVTMKNTGTTTWTAGSSYSLGYLNASGTTLWGIGRVQVSGSVAPGQTTTFTFSVTAPSSTGTAISQWRMVQDGVEWFGDYSPSLTLTVSAATNGAQFVSQSVPTTWTAGQTQTLSVTMKNTGSTTWTAANSYSLGYLNASGTTLWGIGRVQVSGSVAPGQTATFTFSVKAPTSSGTAISQWRMVQDGVEWFGDYTPSLTLTVSAPTNNAQFISQSVPTAWTTGQTQTLSVTMKNTGATTWTAANSYSLGYQNASGTTLWGIGRVQVSGSVAPGQTTTFTFSVKAPASSGTAISQWRMVQDGVEWFGDYSPSLTLTVSAATSSPPTITVHRSPSTLLAGQPYTTSWSTTNATQVTRRCTSSGTGFTDNSTLAVSGSVTATAADAWVGYPSTCTWTATGSGGSNSYVETVTTVSTLPQYAGVCRN